MQSSLISWRNLRHNHSYMHLKAASSSWKKSGSCSGSEVYVPSRVSDFVLFSFLFYFFVLLLCPIIIQTISLPCSLPLQGAEGTHLCCVCFLALTSTLSSLSVPLCLVTFHFFLIIFFWIQL